MSEKILALSSPDIQDIKVIKMPSKSHLLLTNTLSVNDKLKKKANVKEKKTKESVNSTSGFITSDANITLSKLKIAQKSDNKLTTSSIGIQNIPGIFFITLNF